VSLHERYQRAITHWLYMGDMDLPGFRVKGDGLLVVPSVSRRALVRVRCASLITRAGAIIMALAAAMRPCRPHQHLWARRSVPVNLGGIAWA